MMGKCRYPVESFVKLRSVNLFLLRIEMNIRALHESTGLVSQCSTSPALRKLFGKEVVAFARLDVYIATALTCFVTMAPIMQVAFRKTFTLTSLRRFFQRSTATHWLHLSVC